MTQFTLSSTDRAGVPRARGRYLMQSMQLEEKAQTGPVSAGILLTACLFGAAAGLAHTTPVAEVAHATGQILPSGRIHRVQHLEGGIVRIVHVRDGDHVKKGQSLLELTDAAVSSELRQAEIAVRSNEARLRRLELLLTGETELDAGTREVWPPIQVKLFEEQSDAHRQYLALVEAQRRGHEETLAGKISQAEALASEVAILEEQLRIHSNAGEDSVSRIKSLEVQARLARAQSQLSTARAQIEVSAADIEATRQKKREYESRWRQELRAESESIGTELQQTTQHQERLRDRLARLTITAPSDGVVQALVVRNLGAVVAPGEVVMELVPLNDELVAEARVLPRDVGHVQAGQRVDVKISSFDVQQFGSVPGSLQSVSPSTYLDVDQQPYYRAEILLARPFVGSDPARNRLLPGMTLEADIRTGEKTVLDYILKPVYRGFSGALSER